MPSCPVNTTENNMEMVLWEVAFKAAALSIPETQSFLSFRWAKLPPHGQSKVIPLSLFTLSLLSLSLRSSLKHLSHFPFPLQKNQGASELALIVWMIPQVWDCILHVTENRITCFINASRSFIWSSFYLMPGCFAATALSQTIEQSVLQFPWLFKFSFNLWDTAMSWSMGAKRS